jgi:hypothetical protein
MLAKPINIFPSENDHSPGIAGFNFVECDVAKILVNKLEMVINFAVYMISL